MTGTPIALGLGEGKKNTAFDLPRWFKVSATQSGGQLGVWEEEVPPGSGPPLHIHFGQVELFFVIAGDIRFRCGEETIEVASGATVMVPAGAPHGFKNIGEDTARILVALSPGGGEGFFRDVEAEGLDPATDMGRIAEIGDRYGIEFVGPPID